MHKIFFQFHDIVIAWYGVFVAIGFLAGIWTASRRALLRNVPPETVMDIGPWILVGAILGARALFVYSYWDEIFAKESFWEIFMIQHGGLVYYGGLIGATLSGILFIRLKKLSPELTPAKS